tara:strand:+ start:302 stop:1345 length:1044 start_codon:yes stop_codon:yes gene_type:complete
MFFKNMLKNKLILISLILLSTLNSIFASEVNVYTSRHYDSDLKLYQDFSDQTGIKVNIISAKGKALIERLKSEGENSPADIFITVDAGNLWAVQDYGLFRPINSDNINLIVPKKFRGVNNEWIALAKRARVIFYNKQNYRHEELKNLSYETLDSDKWKNKIAIRSSNNLYNQSLVASLIARYGEDYTENWAKGLVENFVRKPQGNDRAQIIAVANNEADLAIANSYYLGLMLSGKKGDKQLNAGKKVKILFPSQNKYGAHINISGAGIMKASKNYDNAIKFLEFMVSEKAQKHLVENTYEYPINPKVKPSTLISQFGTDFKEDNIKVSNFGKYNAAALKLMDRVGWQ